ncbi:MAG: 16S rRNA (cytosine(1402)-N(4))-methyltransferase RsmH [Chloroflexi bacterium]|nr:16S rRNA (cytosine(1402)-N(4))-methyltransferase RsmH [Chloroflexota bacterium]
MTRTRTGRGGSSSRRTSASTPASREKRSSSAPPITSRSGSPDAGTPASPRSSPPSARSSPISGSERAHEPVLLGAVVDLAAPHDGGRYVDGTVGAGGHAAALLERSAPSGRLLGLDVDPAAIEIARRELARYGDRVTLVRASFADLDGVAREHGFAPADAVVLDLGLSSMQLADERRGFSFRAEGPLDMRADPDRPITAADVVNTWDVAELRRVLVELGEEPEAGRIAAAIARRRTRRPFLTADDLGRFVAGVKTRRPRGVDPATRVFQALRMAVNDELASLEHGLRAALEILRPGGRLLVISFHSLEDRAVKTFMVRESRDCICPPHLPTCVCGHRAGVRLISRRPVMPDAEEVRRNPRARSARLRAAEKLAAA